MCRHSTDCAIDVADLYKALESTASSCSLPVHRRRGERDSSNYPSRILTQTNATAIATIFTPLLPLPQVRKRSGWVLVRNGETEKNMQANTAFRVVGGQ